jgi:acetyl esterase/lipase
MAGYSGIKVISVDYRMPPDFPYPAALDDAMAVWKEVVKTTNPKNIAIFGTSTGGGMTLAMVLRAEKEGATTASRDCARYSLVRHDKDGRHLFYRRNDR